MAVTLEYPPGATPLDPDELGGLIPRHMTTQGQLNEWEQTNVLKGQTWAFSPRNREDPLTEGFVRKLHKRMFGQTWNWAGTFRNTEKSIGVAPEQIAVRLKALLDNTRYWLEHETYPLEEAVVRFHHRLVLVHPFSNGNGRHARMMSDVIMIRRRAEPLSWGQSDLVRGGKIRDEYIAALRRADVDREDVATLLAFARS